MPDYITHEGKVLQMISVPERGLKGCDGCYFYHPSASDVHERLTCHKALPACKSFIRRDGMNFIFKFIKNKN